MWTGRRKKRNLNISPNEYHFTQIADIAFRVGNNIAKMKCYFGLWKWGIWLKLAEIVGEPSDKGSLYPAVSFGSTEFSWVEWRTDGWGIGAVKDLEDLEDLKDSLPPPHCAAAAVVVAVVPCLVFGDVRGGLWENTKQISIRSR